MPYRQQYIVHPSRKVMGSPRQLCARASTGRGRIARATVGYGSQQSPRARSWHACALLRVCGPLIIVTVQSWLLCVGPGPRKDFFLVNFLRPSARQPFYRIRRPRSASFPLWHHQSRRSPRVLNPPPRQISSLLSENLWSPKLPPVAELAKRRGALGPYPPHVQVPSSGEDTKASPPRNDRQLGGSAGRTAPQLAFPSSWEQGDKRSSPVPHG